MNIRLPSNLKPADRFVVSHEVVGILHSRAVHVVSRTTNDESSRATAQLLFSRHGTVSRDCRRPSIFLRQSHATVFRTQWHRWIRWLSGQRRQCSVSSVIEAAQTFERTIGEDVQRSRNHVKIFIRSL